MFASGDYDGRRSVAGPDVPQCCHETTEPSKVKCSPEVLTNTAEGSLVSSSVISGSGDPDGV